MGKSLSVLSSLDCLGRQVLVMNRRWYSGQPLINHNEATLALPTDPRNRSDERFPLYVLEWVLLQCVIFTGSSGSYNFEWI